VHVVSIDLSTVGAAEVLRSAVEQQGIRVTSVINNAGVGSFGPFAGEDARRRRSDIAVDVIAPVEICAAFLPDVLERGDGFIINVASMAAYVPTPLMAVYGASKAFILSFTESLWAEVRGSGVTVFALSPGATATEFNDVVGTEDATAGARKRRPADVVATALAHLDRRSPGPSVIDGAGNRLSAALGRLLPRRAAVSMMARLTAPAP